VSSVRIRRIATLLILVVSAIAAVIWFGSGEDWKLRYRMIEEAEGRDTNRALELAKEATELYPDHPEFLWMATQLAQRANQREEAYRLACEIPDSLPWSLAALRLRATLADNPMHFLGEAEAACQKLLKAVPDERGAHEQLAQQYGLTARRFEAIPHILELVRSNHETDLILLIGRERGIIQNDEKLRACRKAAPQDPRPLLGLAWHAMNEERHSEADTLLQEALRLGADMPAVWGLRGRWLATRNQLGPWSEWIRNCPASAESHPDVWLARAQWADHQNDHAAVLRCYWECVRLSPELRQATMRFAQLLAESGNATAATRCQQYLEKLIALESAQDQAFSSGAPQEASTLPFLIDKYQEAGRLWEALALSRVAVQLAPQDPEQARRLAELTQATQDLPLVMTAPSFNPAASLDFSTLPLPRADTTPSHDVRPSPAESSSSISFEDQSISTGFRFRFEDGSRGPRLKMNEITGGGIGVLDYDVDGFPDLFCSQAGNNPPQQPADLSDQLFRNEQGVRFQNAGPSAGIYERGFGQGVAVGDLNSDGFGEIFVGNIGANALWVNEGDGTFTESSAAWGLEGAVWTTSSLIADLNRDGHPDLYEVNYLKGEKLFERTCKLPDGSASQCMPFDFEGETDRLWLNSGDGRLVDATSSLSRVPNGKGLGISAWSPDPQGPVCVLVANDTTPNYFWVPEEHAGQTTWSEQALLAGLALSQEGKPQGSMGISVGDIDGDSRMDACVTNFLAESFAFYRADDAMSFRDEARESGLRDLTWNRLGFGTLMLDADADGELELFLANGHIQDLTRTGRPYRMPPLLCRWKNQQFQAVEPKTLGRYFESDWLARAAASLDWNRDGRIDLLIGHLDDPTLLLTNTSSQSGKSITLRLIARNSAREAIGTTVTFRQGKRTWTRQLIGGGGYQASSEPLIHGAVSGDALDELIIDWPSGTRQRFENVPTPFRGAVLEGENAMFAH